MTLVLDMGQLAVERRKAVLDRRHQRLSVFEPLLGGRVGPARLLLQRLVGEHLELVDQYLAVGGQLFQPLDVRVPLSLRDGDRAVHLRLRLRDGGVPVRAQLGEHGRIARAGHDHPDSDAHQQCHDQRKDSVQLHGAYPARRH